MAYRQSLFSILIQNLVKFLQEFKKKYYEFIHDTYICDICTCSTPETQQHIQISTTQVSPENHVGDMLKEFSETLDEKISNFTNTFTRSAATVLAEVPSETHQETSQEQEQEIIARVARRTCVSEKDIKSLIDNNKDLYEELIKEEKLYENVMRNLEVGFFQKEEQTLPNRSSTASLRSVVLSNNERSSDNLAAMPEQQEEESDFVLVENEQA